MIPKDYQRELRKSWNSLLPEINADLARNDLDQLQFRLQYLFREGILLGVPRRYVESFMAENTARIGVTFIPPSRTRKAG